MDYMMQLKELRTHLPSQDNQRISRGTNLRAWCWHELIWAVGTARHKHVLCCTNARRLGGHLLPGKNNSHGVGGQGMKAEKSRSLAMACKADKPEGADASQYEQVAPHTPGKDTILKSTSRSLESPRSKKNLHECHR